MNVNQSNRDKLIQHMKAFDTELTNDVLLITHPKHVYYFTGFYTNPHERFMGLFWHKEQGWTLILPKLDAQAASSKVDEHVSLISYSDEQDPKAKVHEWLQKLQIDNYWFEDNFLTFDRVLWLQEARPEASCKSLASFVNAIKAIKTSAEIELLQEAANKTDSVLKQALQQFKLGMTESDVVAEIEFQAKKHGAEQMSFGTSVLGGYKSALPHGKAGAEKLTQGFMLIDFGIALAGYTSDMTRTFHIGPWQEEALNIYETVLRAEKAAIAQAKVGMTFEELDSIARTIISEADFGEYFVHRLGHGLGTDVHEYPSISKGNTDKIQEGMVFTIEPGIYVPEFGGVRIEDAVYMTSEGAVALTSFPKESKDVLL
ncbi:aminopeptidase P family protein [Bacillus horti]|uniref:Xaa-Pro dipeptidase n=1 Tax=Caldalkalibacillus horti TaxID=77523 RepID=A0ABT9W4D9_9BACI|nr:Xaa-Pro peptidase family protein [Bacillus horti]MDQ0168114.1 Xaa-Pro dipeptidase [Bacillus horti]